MEILAGKVKVLSTSSSEAIAETLEVLSGGGIVVYPTDTLYGLGGDALNVEAVERVSRIKGREGPWSIAVSDLEMLAHYCEIPEKHASFVKQNLPGPVTLILPGASERLAPALLGDGRSIGVRIPGHPVAVDLVRRLGKPITSTSVNRSGEPSMNDPNQIAEKFSNEVDLILNAGTLPPSGGSTIFNLTTERIEKLR